MDRPQRVAIAIKLKRWFLVVTAMTLSLITCDLGAVFELIGATSACAVSIRHAAKRKQLKISLLACIYSSTPMLHQIKHS